MLPWIWPRSQFPRLPRPIDTHKSCSPFRCHKAGQILLFRGRMPGHNRWTTEKMHLQWYQYLRSILPRGKHQWIFDLRKGQQRGLTTFVLPQRKTVFIQPGARLLKECLKTVERRKKKKQSKNQANRRPFSAFHTPTLDSLCSLMFLMYAHSPVIRPKYFPYITTMVRKSADLRGRENKDMSWAVADPDIQIRVGPGHPDSEIKGGGGGRS